MATYKVLQDIEAEDKLVGPLSLRQFIYAAVGAVALYICFLGLSKGAPFLMVPFLPVGIIAGFFAFPWKGEQPTEIWALARLRFMVKPRTRIWNQSGVKEIVTITAPKKVDDGRPKTDNLSQTEVRSRLKALADTIDSRGWATRNVNFRYYTNAQSGVTDRLVNASDLKPGSVPMDAFLPANDMLDERSQIAQTINNKLNQGAAFQRQQAQAYASGFMQQPAAPTQPLQPMQPQFAPIATQQPTVQPAVQVAPIQPVQPIQPIQAAPVQPLQIAPAPATLPVVAPQPMPQLPPPVMPAAVPPLSATAPSAPHWFASDVTAAATPLPTPPASTTAPAIATPAPVAPSAPALTPSEPVTRPTDPAILKLANNNDLNVATLARQAQKDVNRGVSRHGNEVEVSLR